MYAFNWVTVYYTKINGFNVYGYLVNSHKRVETSDYGCIICKSLQIYNDLLEINVVGEIDCMLQHFNLYIAVKKFL